VCDGDRLRGWVDAEAIEALDGATVAAASTRPFRAVVRPDTTLKAALDGIVTSQTRVAVVVDEDGTGADGADASTHSGRYLGMLTLDELAEGITT
jgi:hypothetical protein